MSLRSFLRKTMMAAVLGVVYYAIVTPIGLILRTLGRQPLKQKWDRSRPTYWHYRDDAPLTRADYERQH